MKPHLFVLTGASRGMGLAMAQQLLAADHLLVGMSRTRNEPLAQSAKALGAGLLQWQVDLEDPLAAAAQLAQWLAAQAPGAFASATLINNAAIVPRISPLSQADAADLSRVLRIGLEAPLLLTAAFLAGTEGAAWGALPRKVLNISSGNGRRPMASQSSYSAVKAGMDHFTRCLALEEALKPHGAKVCSLAPGVIDTDMQTQLRNADASLFPDHARFVAMQTQGQLSSPQDAAARVLAYLARSDFGSNPVADVREA